MRNIFIKLLLCSLLALSFAAPDQASAQQSKKRQAQIPMLSQLSQISPNQLQVTYDQPVDQTKGTTPGNYWIQSTTEVTPTGIATLGKNDSVNNGNALTADKVMIQPVANNAQSFMLTFKQDIPKGMSYKMIICYVTQPGEPPYTGANGSAVFVGQ
ncbi:hypothetical protein D7Z26_21255 [Cohnella endophytica]|uniref:Uncharacterized protein n=1 Tax=Cohnella endophytica TaxID=2419778 RepID=A0A494XGC5_9BACL|nr:hypothetical protein [Cohnella endophytica]RKP48892.1 hypothetical protein D7Z26_21255 [Cohnella endophytica]